MGVFQTLLAGKTAQVAPIVCVLKFPITAAGAFRVRFCGVVRPARAPTKPENW